MSWSNERAAEVPNCYPSPTQQESEDLCSVCQCRVSSWSQQHSNSLVHSWEPLLCSRRRLQQTQWWHPDTTHRHAGNKHDIDIIGRVIKESPYSLVSPGIGPIFLSHTLRWRNKVPSSEQQLERGELFQVLFPPWAKAVLRGPSKQECGEKGRHPTQHAMRGNCSFIKRWAQSQSDISRRPCSQRLLNHSDCL